MVYIVIRDAGSLVGERQVGLQRAGQVGVRSAGQPAEAARTGLEVAGRLFK